MRSDVFVYISGPITAKDGYIVEENVAVGVRTFLDLIQLGIPAYSPQMTAAFPSAFNISWERWMEYDYAVIRRCTHMLMLPRWVWSKGAIREKEYAKSIGLPIAYSIDDLLKMLLVKAASSPSLADGPEQPHQRTQESSEVASQDLPE